MNLEESWNFGGRLQHLKESKHLSNLRSLMLYLMQDMACCTSGKFFCKGHRAKIVTKFLF